MIDDKLKKSALVISLGLFILSTTACDGELDPDDDNDQPPSVNLLWESEASLQVPESVRFDNERQVLYVSNIIGAPWGRDGIASISKVALDGTVIDANWVSGTELNAPKGLAIYGDQLFAADLDSIAVIDIDSGSVVDKISVTGASGLNDLSIDEFGVIYVTDSFTGTLTRIENGFQTSLFSGFESLNGVYADGNDIYFLSNGGLYVTDIVGSETRLIIDNLEGATDGLEKLDDDAWLITCWSGVSYIVHDNRVTGKVSATKVLDTREAGIYSADLGYDPETKTAYLPTFWGNSIQAFKVTKGNPNILLPSDELDD